MSWPPQIGEPLPRAEQVWYEVIKFDEWILAEQGHGEEWQRVFQIGREDREQLWEAIVEAMPSARVAIVRDRGAKGIVCSVKVELEIGDRTAPVTVGWHYANESATPRLVTAYITL